MDLKEWEKLSPEEQQRQFSDKPGIKDYNMKELCPCLTERYKHAFVSSLSCTIDEFEKLSGHAALNKPTDKDLQIYLRAVIDNHKNIREEVESLPLCNEIKMSGKMVEVPIERRL